MSDQPSYHCLVVDDSPDVRRLTKRALEADGFTCDTAEDGQAALELLQGRSYDIIISDLRMPRLHGHKLMIELLDKGSTTPFIVITAICDPRVIRDLYARGAADVITKPYNYAILAVRVRHVIEQFKRPARRGRSGAVRVDVRGDAGDADDSLQDTRDDNTSRESGDARANLLQEQLAKVTHRFESTIDTLTRQRAEIELGYLGSVRVFASLIEKVGPIKRHHATRVERACTAIANVVEYPAAKVLHLKVAALLHEIGTFGMPAEIRLKAPWTLDSGERRVYEQYPNIGASFLADIENGKHVVELVKGHAENFNGTGFPAKKTGDEVSLGARILQIADGCDTYLMYDTSEHPSEALRRYLKEEKGRKFDPLLVPVALDYFLEQLRSADTREYPIAGRKAAPR